MLSARARMIANLATLGAIAGSGLYVHLKERAVTPELRNRVRLIAALEACVEIMRSSVRSGWLAGDGVRSVPRHKRALEARLADAGLTVVEDRIEPTRRVIRLSMGSDRIEIELVQNKRGLRFVTGRAVRADDTIELRALLDGVQ